MTSVNTLWTARRRRPSMIAARPPRSRSSQRPRSHRSRRLARLTTHPAGRGPLPAGAARHRRAAAGPVDGRRRPTPITLDQAAKMALDRNLDIAVQRLNPQMFDLSLAGVARRICPPSPRSSATSIKPRSRDAPHRRLAGHDHHRHGERAAHAEPDARRRQPDRRLEQQSGLLEQLLLQLQPRVQRDLAAQYTQPLLRGLQFDGARQQLAVTPVNREMSDLQLQATISNILVAVRNAYWDLVLAVQSIDLAQASVDLRTSSSTRTRNGCRRAR